jgi:hypothetical protein
VNTCIPSSDNTSSPFMANANTRQHATNLLPRGSPPSAPTRASTRRGGSRGEKGPWGGQTLRRLVEDAVEEETDQTQVGHPSTGSLKEGVRLPRVVRVIVMGHHHHHPSLRPS